MQDLGIGYVFKTKICNKVQSNQFQLQTVSEKFAAVLVPVCKASKKFLKHIVLFVVLLIKVLRKFGKFYSVI